MTVPNDLIRLEVDTSSPRNLIRNPSGADLYKGITLSAGVTPLATGSISIHDNGSLFRIAGSSPGSPLFLQLPRIQVVAGQYLGLALDTIRTGVARSLTIQLYFTDSNGVQFAFAVMGTINVSTTAMTDQRFTILVPAGAVGVDVEIRAQDNAGVIYLSKIMVRTGATSALASGPYVPAVWTSIGGTLQRITTDVGNELDGAQDKPRVGSLTALIRSATLDPASTTTLHKGRPIRLRAVVGGNSYPIFRGLIETADTSYEAVKKTATDVRISLVAIDSNRSLSEAPAPYNYIGGDGLGGISVDDFEGQIGSAAAAANMPAIGLNDLTLTPRNGPLSRDDSAKASDWVRRACNTHRGVAWVDADGWLQCRLTANLGTSAGVTFSDKKTDAGAVYYTGLDLNFGSRALVNSITIKRINLDEVEDDGAKVYGPYTAPTSIATYGQVSDEVEITHKNPADIAGLVLPVFATPKIFPSGVSVTNLQDHPLLATMLAISQYTPIRVKRSTLFDATVRVLQIRHEITPTGWKIEYTPRPMEATTAVPIGTPSAGANTGPGDLAGPPRGILGLRYRNTEQGAIPSGGTVAINYNVVARSDGIVWDDSNSRFVIPRDGRYMLDASCRISGPVCYRSIGPFINGLQAVRTITYADNINTEQVSISVVLVAGDVVQFRAGATAAGCSVQGDPFADTHCSIAFIGP